MKLRELISSLPQELRRDGEIILAKLLKVEVPKIPLLLESEIPESTRENFKKLIRERSRGIPTAYLIGEWEFYGRIFRVRRGVLVPRPETEILVEKVLEVLPKDKELTGFEVGTGTGCISITLLLERPHLTMYGTDINPEAVQLTLENARIHGVDKRLSVNHGSLFEPFKEVRADFVVSNPPYIPQGLWESLPPEVRIEGMDSLVGGKEGTEFIKKLIEESGKVLKEGGFIALEIGHDQAEKVTEIMRENGFKRIKVFRDYSGSERVVIGWS